MDRRAFIFAVAACSVWKSAGAREKLPRIGFLSPADKPGPNHRAFVDQLARLGWVEGKTLDIAWRWLGQRYDALPAAAEELAREGLSLVVTQTQAVTLAMMKATQATPIVFVGVRDPVAAGIVRSLNRPGGNVTGVTLAPTGEVVAKQFEILKEIAPTLSRVAVLWNPDVPVQRGILEEIRLIGTSIGITATGMPISHQGDVEKAFDSMSGSRPEAVMTLVDSFSLANRALIARLAVEQRMLTSFEVKDYVSAGGLMSYGLPYLDHYAYGAVFVSKVLAGADPGELPVEQPTKYELVVNARTARQIGLEFPMTVLARADDVIE